MRTRQTALLLGLAATALFITVDGPAWAHGRDRHACSVARLDGLYVFAATGVVTSGPFAGPTAIVELIRFNGDGAVSVPGVTLSANGTIVPIPPGGTGTYTVTDVVPPDGACTGTLTFDSPGAPTLALYFPLKADTIWMIQTNEGSVLQGTATKLAR